MQGNETRIRYRGRFRQLVIYLGKFFRLFVLQSDWKVLPMSAIIAGMVSLAVGKGLFQTMEGTFQGAFALTCVCIWNGFFNSIQSICRERTVVKREHRAGLHVTSYVGAHMIYQAFLCAMQSIITIVVLFNTGVVRSKEIALSSTLARLAGNEGLALPDYMFTTELFITLFLVTYSADLMALMISAIVHTQMAAMTVMPFMLIIQLVFSGFIALPASFADISKLMLSKWGVQGLCVIANYNKLPAVTIWNKLVSGSDKLEIGGVLSLKDVINAIEEQGMRDTVLNKLGEISARDDFASNMRNLNQSWIYLILLGVIFAIVTVVFLEFVDKDKR